MDCTISKADNSKKGMIEREERGFHLTIFMLFLFAVVDPKVSHKCTERQCEGTWVIV